MREIVDGVIEIPIGYVKAYAVVVDERVVLVDIRRNGLIRRSPRIVTEDRVAELASIARLGNLSFEFAVFGHGRAISREAAQRFREFAARG